MMLNEGVDVATNKTVLPHSAYIEITTNQAIMTGRTSEPYFSPSGYGLGWMHKSYQGHEVNHLTIAFKPVLMPAR